MSYGEIPTTEIPYTGGRNIPAVNVVESTMSTFLHEKTIEYLKLLFSSQYQRENLCDTIRQHMTYSFGPLWHVIMVEDRQFTYEFAKSSHDHLVVHIGKHIFIIWRQILEDVFPASLSPPYSLSSCQMTLILRACSWRSGSPMFSFSSVWDCSSIIISSRRMSVKRYYPSILFYSTLTF